MHPFDPCNIPLSGPHLVEASAGTGKTYAITTLYLRLILERNLRVEQILVVTFTEAATAELKDRVRGRLRACLDALELPADDTLEPADPLLADLLARIEPTQARRRLLAALNGFDEAAIFTIHAFCMRMLRDSAFESGMPFDAELITSQQHYLTEIVNDFWVRERHDRYPFEVSHLDSQLRPADLRRLASMAAENPTTEVLPGEGGDVVEKRAVEMHQALFGRLRIMWLEHEDNIRDLLTRALAEKRLKGYRRDWLDNWLAELEGFFANRELRRLQLPAHFVKFCAGRMVANKGKTVPDHAFFETCQSLLDSHERLSNGLQHMVERAKNDLVAEVHHLLPQKKEVHNQLYFQDLLHYLDRALHGEGGELLCWIIRNRFPAALIDEFQDTDELQYRIFNRLFLEERKSLFLIGDPKQAIYAFRGADIFTYLTAVGDVAEHAYTMNTNWRSDPDLIKAVNKMFLGHANPFLFEQIGFPAVGPRPGARNEFQRPDQEAAPLCFTLVDKPEDLGTRGMARDWADKHVTAMVAVRISKLLASGATVAGQEIEPGHIAVLVRTNKQAQAVRNALARYHIPCVLHGNVSVFQTDEAHELELVLRAVAEPSRSQKVKVALCTYLLGCSANDIMDMEAEPVRWEQRIKQFRQWRELWQNQGFIQMFRSLIAQSDMQRRLFATNEGERALTNLLHLAELLQEAANREHLGPAGLLAWLEKQRDVELAEETAYELRLESDARAVAVVTIHRSKGLEYPVVFCPYAWESVHAPRKASALLYHDPQKGCRVLDLREDNGEARKQVEREEFAERLRLLYVALTRARHYVEIVWGPFNGCGKSPLGYLLYGRDGDADSKTLKELHKDEAFLFKILEDRVASSGGLWQTRRMDPEERGVRYRPHTEVPHLEMRPYRRRLKPSRRNASFTQLTAASEHQALLPVRDHDELAVNVAPLPNLLSARAAEAIPLREFPKGARAGIFFHSVLEHFDFSCPEPERLERQVELELRKAGFDARWLPSLVPAIRRVLQTPMLPAGAPRLADIGMGDRLNELEFLFPVAARAEESLLNPSNLAEVFRSHAQDLPEGYADKLEQLGFKAFRGYMKGFVDLIFRYEGRWYVVDYKSNYLGGTFEDFAAAKLPAAMAESHYYLQYHIYTVATHRFLQHRLPDYRYERDFGGALYLFIKGMDPDLGADYGVFFDRPPAARIAALSALMGTPERAVRV